MRSSEAHHVMWHQIFPEPDRHGSTLQSQLRVRFVDAVLAGRLLAGMRLPSSRELADMLGVSRNTVVLAYEKLAEDGYLENRPRNGYYVSDSYMRQMRDSIANKPTPSKNASSEVDWHARMGGIPQTMKWLDKPSDWQRYRYPFLYGQFDPSLFPIADWRECSRKALDVSAIRGWAPDAIDNDNESLVEQLIRHVLPRRGIAAKREEVLLTVGAQQALYLVTELLIPPNSTVGVKTPDIWMRAIFSCDAAPPCRRLRSTVMACCPIRRCWRIVNTSIAHRVISARPASHCVPNDAWRC